MRPAHILYGLDERPPLVVLLLSTAQQTAATAAISFATLIAVFTAAGADLATISNALRVAMLTLGLVTVLHCTRLGPVGSNYLVPAVFATSYLPGMMIAAKGGGGLPVIFGMTVFAGAAQALLSRLMPRLRPFFPTEITGFVVFTIGLGMGTVGVEEIAGSHGSAAHGAGIASAGESLLGLVTLAAMVGFAIWSSGTPRTFCVLIGIVVGYLSAWAGGQLNLQAFTTMGHESWLAWPQLFPAVPQFSPELILPFLVGAVACSLRTIGDVTTAQKLNDARWQRPDLQSIEGGILASGLGNMVGGLLGSIGCNTASSGVGLSGATGVTSRVVGYAMAGLFALLSLVPSVAVLLAIMPHPVLGAVLIFTGCMVIMNGLQMILSRVIDSRKTLVIGIALILNIAHDLFPQLFADVPPFLQPFTQSAVVISITAALALNLLFRIGVRRTMAISYRPGDDAAQFMYTVMHQQGGVWGARQDVIQRVIRALSEFAEIAPMLAAEGSAIHITGAFDEFNLDLTISWQGRPFEVARLLPTQEELLEDDDAMVRLASILIARATDRLTIRDEGNQQRLLLHFDH